MRSGKYGWRYSASFLPQNQQPPELHFVVITVSDLSSFLSSLLIFPVLLKTSDFILSDHTVMFRARQKVWVVLVSSTLPFIIAFNKNGLIIYLRPVLAPMEMIN